MAGGVIANGGGGGGGDYVKEYYPGKLTRYVITTCIVAAMGGLIFGYDIGISGGVTSMAPFLKKFFPTVYRKEELDQSTDQYCKFDSQILTLFTSSLYLAALVASLFASWVTKRWGRRITMMFGGIIFLAGAALNAAAVHVAMLIGGRILLGIGVGFANQSVPLYLSEMAPYKYRGALNVVFQLSITVGILIANLVNYFTSKISGGWGWRVSLGGAGVPAIFIAVSAFILSETPNSLIDMGKSDEAKSELRRIRGVVNVEAEFSDLVAASEASKQVKRPWQNLFRRRQYRPQLVLSILIPLFQQLTGINVVMFYAPVLFKTIGFGSDASLMSAVITGGVNFAATFISVYGTDKWGRRALFLAGGFIMLIFQIAVAIFIGTEFGVSGTARDLPTWYAIVVVICICAYVSAFAFSWGPLGWLVPSEISPLEIRSAAQSVTVSTNMLFTFVVAQFFLTMLCHTKFGLFFIFAIFVVVMTVFVYLLVPETKNIPIEEMSQVWREHRFWKRFMDEDAASSSSMEKSIEV